MLPAGGQRSGGEVLDGVRVASAHPVGAVVDDVAAVAFDAAVAGRGVGVVVVVAVVFAAEFRQVADVGVPAGFPGGDVVVLGLIGGGGAAGPVAEDGVGGQERGLFGVGLAP